MKIIRTDYLNPAFQELVAQLNDRPCPIEMAKTTPYLNLMKSYI